MPIIYRPSYFEVRGKDCGRIVPARKEIEPSPWVYSKRSALYFLGRGVENGCVDEDEFKLVATGIIQSCIPEYIFPVEGLPRFHPEALTLQDVLDASCLELENLNDYLWPDLTLH